MFLSLSVCLSLLLSLSFSLSISFIFVFLFSMTHCSVIKFPFSLPPCPSVYIFISICLSACLSISASLSFCMSVCLPLLYFKLWYLNVSLVNLGKHIRSFQSVAVFLFYSVSVFLFHNWSDLSFSLPQSLFNFLWWVVNMGNSSSLDQLKWNKNLRSCIFQELKPLTGNLIIILISNSKWKTWNTTHLEESG